MHNKLHLHSMAVHAVYALVLVAAGAFVLAACTTSSLLGLDPRLWDLLVKGSLIVVLLSSIPATVTGVLERSHMYATWHRTHQLKLVVSLMLMGALVLELVLLLGTEDPYRLTSVLAAAIVLANPVLALLLGAWGFKITLGRQSLAGTSYIPDAKQQPPVDILVTNAELITDDAKLLDILNEGSY